MSPWKFLCFIALISSPLAAADGVDYQRDVKPLLAEKCTACHGALKQESDLRLDAGVLIRKGGSSGAVIDPGHADKSEIFRRVSSKDEFTRMPPKGEGAALTAEEINVLSRWIDSGAEFPKDETIPAKPADHWAYQVPERPEIPPVEDAAWSHPIDTFIAKKHQQLGLTPVGRADRYTRLRRVYQDLIGLPPTRKQIEAFLEDDSSQAWDNVVDALLANPHYGERWGRHWMDVWRYSDWNGYKQQLRGSQRHIWRWRDWIIRSLNDDKGYDRMITEMLAADELAPTDESMLPATGFLARNYHKSNRNIWLDATVEHTAKAFLGMTLNCARCHDHKFDPIPQTAYYQFRAIFEPHKVRTDRVPGQPDVMKDGLPRAFDADLSAETFLYRQGDEKRPDKENPLSPAVPAFLGGEFDVQPVELPVEGFYPSLREFVEEEAITKAKREFTAAKKALEEQSSTEKADPDKLQEMTLKRDAAEWGWKSLKARYEAERKKFQSQEETETDSDYEEFAKEAAQWERRFKEAKAELKLSEARRMWEAEKASDQTDEKKKQAAIAAAKKEFDAAKKALAKVKEETKKTDGNYSPIGTVYPQTSSGRRLALARWITDRKNPLTARVAVNHIWMRHFGEPLVENVFDFGLRSEKPEHAELLDWLALELIENDWSMKPIHRLIVTSRTWQLASSADSKNSARNPEIDPDNEFLWRMNVQRLDAEIIRDNVLAVSGGLDKTRGGPDIDYRKGETSKRRSIYLRHAYEKQNKMLVLFDAASPNECYRRSESIIPQQALALTNSSLSLSRSRKLAGTLSSEVSDNDAPDSDFIRSAFLRILSRPPEAEELAACRQFLDHQAKLLADPSGLNHFVGGEKPKVEPSSEPRQRARENLIHVLMNHNDFVSVR